MSSTEAGEKTVPTHQPEKNIRRSVELIGFIPEEQPSLLAEEIKFRRGHL